MMPAGCPEKPLSYDRWLDHIRQDPAVQANLVAFVAYARTIATSPIIERVQRMDAVIAGKGRNRLDGRYLDSAPATRESFVLSMADCNASEGIYVELPTLAAAWRLSGERVFLDRCLAQMDELAGWDPLQRPGWSQFNPNSVPFTDPRGDGAWLATGRILVGLVEALQMLPVADVPAQLRTRLHVLFEREITGCVDDWNKKRAWFYEWHNPFTNQWVVPTAGYLLASSYLGRDTHRDAYELGVEHLLMSLDAYGTEGAQVEGLGYGSFTMDLLLHAARWVAVEGDDRLMAHPFIHAFPLWVVHHIQPGGFVINAFDQGGGPRVGIKDGRRQGGCSGLMALLAMTGSSAACWAVRQSTGGAQTLAGLMAASAPLPPEGYAPPLWGVYERTCRVNWRSGWAEDATGVWVRGCHPDDQHTHADHGHVNFIRNGRSVFIEAGACLYHSPDGSLMASAFGHNTLLASPASAAEWHNQPLRDFPKTFPPKLGTAPIRVARLDAAGGDVMVDVTSSYRQTMARWQRQVVWSADTIRIEDTAERLAPGRLQFRWHLGTVDTPAVSGEGNAWTVEWADATVLLAADVPLLVTIEPMPDNTLGTRLADERSTYPTHACIVIETVGEVPRMRLKTVVQP